MSVCPAASPNAPPSAADPRTLLCERCGYVIDGLACDGNCPECGADVAPSIPAHRTGTPWQRRADGDNWLRTNAQMLTRPMHWFSVMRIRGREDNVLLVLNLLSTTGLLVVTAWMTWLWLLAERKSMLSYGDAIGSLALAIAGGFLVFATLRVLVWIEFRGVQFFSDHRGWRVNEAVASTVCAHASVGWLVGGTMALAGAVIIGLTEADARLPRLAIGIRGALYLPAAGMFAGLLIFETLVFLGARRCRFANLHRTKPTVRIDEDGRRNISSA